MRIETFGPSDAGADAGALAAWVEAGVDGAADEPPPVVQAPTSTIAVIPSASTRDVRMWCSSSTNAAGRDIARVPYQRGPAPSRSGSVTVADRRVRPRRLVCPCRIR